MSNFEMLLENENILPVAEQVFQDSCQELVNNIDEELLFNLQN